MKSDCQRLLPVVSAEAKAYGELDAVSRGAIQQGHLPPASAYRAYVQQLRIADASLKN